MLQQERELAFARELLVRSEVIPSTPSSTVMRKILAHWPQAFASQAKAQYPRRQGNRKAGFDEEFASFEPVGLAGGKLEIGKHAVEKHEHGAGEDQVVQLPPQRPPHMPAQREVKMTSSSTYMDAAPTVFSVGTGELVGTNMSPTPKRGQWLNTRTIG
jgi:hypothetical protein